MSRIAFRLVSAALAAGAIVAAAALPASAADHGRSGPARSRVVIGDVHHAGRGSDVRSNRSLNEEWVTVTNKGRHSVRLDRWTLTDADHHVYRFGHVSLRGHQSVRIHTGNGRNTDRDLYQDRRASVFDKSRDTATLRDGRGHVVDTESWGGRHHR
ncbi:lamin tail domain-containing protein [Streptomyces sp. NBC_01198]|uniref:lamin tail domain-containing protein n=1 Tax=Streptomyces sp. NBC_01198 TaxID=2903769 RepID=UPI002E134C56|nr:lamin tail domain-containing protein [Streptomyces sp. NBC_01198]